MVQTYQKFTNRGNTGFCVKQGLFELSITLFYCNSMHAIVLEERYKGLSSPNKLALVPDQTLPNFDQWWQVSQVILRDREKEIQHLKTNPWVREKISELFLA